MEIRRSCLFLRGKVMNIKELVITVLVSMLFFAALAALLPRVMDAVIGNSADTGGILAVEAEKMQEKYEHENSRETDAPEDQIQAKASPDSYRVAPDTDSASEIQDQKNYIPSTDSTKMMKGDKAEII